MLASGFFQSTSAQRTVELAFQTINRFGYTDYASLVQAAHQIPGLVPKARVLVRLTEIGVLRELPSMSPESAPSYEYALKFKKLLSLCQQSVKAKDTIGNSEVTLGHKSPELRSGVFEGSPVVHDSDASLICKHALASISACLHADAARWSRNSIINITPILSGLTSKYGYQNAALAVMVSILTLQHLNYIGRFYSNVEGIQMMLYNYKTSYIEQSDTTPVDIV